MTIINSTCNVCGIDIKTNKSNRDYDISKHIESNHPTVYKQASEIKNQIEVLKEEFFLLSGCWQIRMFPERK